MYKTQDLQDPQGVFVSEMTCIISWLYDCWWLVSLLLTPYDICLFTVCNWNFCKFFDFQLNVIFLQNVSVFAAFLKACTLLITEFVLLTAGTPIQNSVKDLWTLIKFLNVEPFQDKQWWDRTIERPVVRGDKTGIKWARVTCVRFIIGRSFCCC